MRCNGISVAAVLLLLSVTSNAEVGQAKCIKITASDFDKLRPALEAKIIELESKLKGRVTFTDGLVCSSVISAWYYTPEISPHGTGIPHLTWDLATSKAEIRGGL